MAVVSAARTATVPIDEDGRQEVDLLKEQIADLKDDNQRLTDEADDLSKQLDVLRKRFVQVETEARASKILAKLNTDQAQLVEDLLNG